MSEPHGIFVTELASDRAGTSGRVFSLKISFLPRLAVVVNHAVACYPIHWVGQTPACEARGRRIRDDGCGWRRASITCRLASGFLVPGPLSTTEAGARSIATPPTSWPRSWLGATAESPRVARAIPGGDIVRNRRLPSAFGSVNGHECFGVWRRRRGRPAECARFGTRPLSTIQTTCPTTWCREPHVRGPTWPSAFNPFED